MKTKNYIKIIITILVIAYTINYVTSSPYEIPGRCQEGTVQNKVDCLNKFIAPHYSYELNKDRTRTWHDILINGGDCYDYTKLYIENFKNRKLNTERIRIYNEGKPITYCLVDQLNTYCLNVSGGNYEFHDFLIVWGER